MGRERDVREKGIWEGRRLSTAGRKGRGLMARNSRELEMGAVDKSESLVDMRQGEKGSGEKEKNGFFLFKFCF